MSVTELDGAVFRFLRRSHFYRFLEWLVLHHLEVVRKGDEWTKTKSVLFLIGFAAVSLLLALTISTALLRTGGPDISFLLLVMGFLTFVELGFRVVGGADK